MFIDKKSVFAVIGPVLMVACGGSGSSSTNNAPAASPAPVAPFSLEKCPVLDGTYKEERIASGDHRMKITEIRSEGSYRITVGDGAQEMTIDGQPKALKNATGSYTGTCDSGVLQIELKTAETKGQMKLYFITADTIVIESHGMDDDQPRFWKRL